MPDARYPRGGSPASTFDDYSQSPPPAYPRSRSRSRPARRNSVSKSPLRSRPQSRRTGRRDSLSSSRSSSRSQSRDGRSRRTKLKEGIKDKTTTTSGMKTSLVFLGSVAAATYAAHKFWPKGITYGEKEEWEIEKAVKKEKAKKKAEWEGYGAYDGPSRGRDDYYGDRDYDRPRSSHGRLGIEEVPRMHRDGPPPEVDRIVYARRPLDADRYQVEGQTSTSVASSSRAADARRAQYIEESRTVLPERGSDDYRIASRYVEYEPRRYSYDEPADARRGEPIVYVRRDNAYR